MKDGPEREDVGALIGRLSADLLRGHISHRTQHGAGERLENCRSGISSVTRRQDAGGGQELGDTEIDDLDPAVRRHEQVFGFQIAVHDALLVGRGQTARDLRRVSEGGVERQLFVKAVAQCLAGEKLGDEIGSAIECPHVVDREHVRVVQGARRASLELESMHGFQAARQCRGHHLHCDIATQACIAGAVDDAHSTGTELDDDFVGPDP